MSKIKLALLFINNVNWNSFPNELHDCYGGYLSFNDPVHHSNNVPIRQEIATILTNKFSNKFNSRKQIYEFQEWINVKSETGLTVKETPQSYWSYYIVEVDTSKPWTIKRYEDKRGFGEKLVYLTPDNNNSYYLND